jgi:hypothetical protein
MNRSLQALLLIGFGLMQIPAAAPDASAADLSVTRKKASARVIHRHRVRVVRDYDGTPIVLRRARPMWVRDLDGTTRVVHHLSNAYPVDSAMPRTYLNGEPVRPITRPRLFRRS